MCSKDILFSAVHHPAASQLKAMVDAQQMGESKTFSFFCSSFFCGNKLLLFLNWISVWKDFFFIAFVFNKTPMAGSEQRVVLSQLGWRTQLLSANTVCRAQQQKATSEKKKNIYNPSNPLKTNPSCFPLFYHDDTLFLLLKWFSCCFFSPYMLFIDRWFS